MRTNLLAGQFCLYEELTDMVKDAQDSFTCILKERLDEYGPESLLDTEILNLLTGIPVAHLQNAVDDYGVNDVIKFIDTLVLTKPQRQKLELLNAYYKRVLSSSFKARVALGNSSAVGAFAISLFTDKCYESFFLLCLDAQNRLIKAIEVHKGTLNEAPVYPRMIVEQAILHKANSVILSHNHPGGSLCASAPDRDVTRRIKSALDPISIAVVDHVIVAEGRYMSFAETGLL
jgi:DNA repair protein RadC